MFMMSSFLFLLLLFLLLPFEHRASVKRYVSLVPFSQTVGRTPWTGDQPVARPLLNTDIRTLSEIRTYDPSVLADEDGS
jgi:hypothetical protein